MIKKTMYFYDEKQANLIKKVNDKLHRQRGVKVGDAKKDKKDTNVYPKKAADEVIKEINNVIIAFKKEANKYPNTPRGDRFTKASKELENIIKKTKKDKDYVSNIIEELLYIDYSQWLGYEYDRLLSIARSKIIDIANKYGVR